MVIVIIILVDIINYSIIIILVIVTTMIIVMILMIIIGIVACYYIVTCLSCHYQILLHDDWLETTIISINSTSRPTAMITNIIIIKQLSVVVCTHLRQAPLLLLRLLLLLLLVSLVQYCVLSGFWCKLLAQICWPEMGDKQEQITNFLPLSNPLL